MSGGELALWVVFALVVAAMLALDLGVFHRKAHTVGVREAAVWSLVWIGLSLAFNLAIYLWLGPQRGAEFLTGYLIEKSLSVDNVFVFAVIFGYFAVPAEYQHRVLFWGILGAAAMRILLIFGGITLLENLHWMVYVFGAFLIFTGARLATQRGDKVHPERNLALRLFKRIVPATDGYAGARFFVRQGGRTYATLLLLVLLVVETTDLVFALDSIPAILAITTDPFIVFTSNIFAILGLRALYFLIAGGLLRLRYLQPGLAAILVFVGAKMALSDFYKVPIAVSLAVVAGILLIAVVASVALRNRSQRGVRPTVEEEHTQAHS